MGILAERKSAAMTPDKPQPKQDAAVRHSLPRMVRPPTPDPLTMRDITSDFVKSNGWTELVTTIPGTPQVKMLYKSPLTGHYHALSFALGMVLEHHGIPAA